MLRPRATAAFRSPCSAFALSRNMNNRPSLVSPRIAQLHASTRSASPAKPTAKMHPLITLEDHFLSAFMPRHANLGTFPPPIHDQLREIGPQRLADMDAGKTTLQVMSAVAGADGTPEQCRAANDELAAAIAAPTSQGRLAGFAALPMATPAEAAAELERCVRELGFVGALVDCHLTDGRFYDGEEFWGVFEMAEKLDCAFYVHPTFPADWIEGYYGGNFNKLAQGMLGSAGWGWHAETGLHVLRLFAAGVFDRFPGLKLVIGHMGEMLPFQLERILSQAARGAYGEHKRGLKEVWDENIWITTSGMFSVNPMACLLRNTRIERIMYSVDYPFASNKAGLAFMEELEQSGLVTDEQLACIAYKNAEQLLKLKV